MSSWHWNKEVRVARNAQELLGLARDFVAKLSPEEIATLPPTCREIRIKGIDDLYFWHERLAEAYFSRASRGDPTQAHRDMLDFFTVAAERANELVGSSAGGGTGEEIVHTTTVRGGKRVLH